MYRRWKYVRRDSWRGVTRSAGGWKSGISCLITVRRVPVSAGRRDAFRRFNAAGTGTPSRFGGRRYGRTTNPSRRFVERFQYGSGVRPAERGLAYYVWWKRQVEFLWRATFVNSLCCLRYNNYQLINPNLVEISEFSLRVFKMYGTYRFQLPKCIYSLIIKMQINVYFFLLH